MTNRPIMIGTVPKTEKITKQENFAKLKEVPGENIRAFGWVEYPEKLTFEDIYNYELYPRDDVEYANYMFWYKSDKNSEEAERIKRRYLDLPLEELEKWKDRDPFSNYAYLIKKNINRG